MAAGATWMVAFKLVVRGIGFISTLILARLLMPEDFGLVAIAMAIYALLELMGHFSFDMALIQRQDVTRRHYDTAWTFNVLVNTAAAVIFVVLGKPAAQFFGEPRVTSIVYALAGMFLLNGMVNIGVVEFRKRMDFRKEFVFLVVRKIVAFCITIPLAFWLRNYWAMIAGMLAGRATALVMSYLMHPYRPRLTLAARGDLFHFSKWLYLNNLLQYLNQRLPEVVLGRLATPGAVGIYAVGSEISNLPTTELVSPLNRAVFPGYAKLFQQEGSIRDAYLSVAGIVALVVVPAGFGIAAASELLVPALLGGNWTEAVPVIGLLAFGAAVGSLQANAGSAFVAMGRPRILSCLAALRLIVLLPSVILGAVANGAEGAAFGFLLTSLAMTPVGLTVTFRTIGIRARDYFRRVHRPLVSALVMYGVVSTMSERFADNGSEGAVSILAAVALVVIGAGVYGVCVLLLWQLAGAPRGAERLAVETVVGRLSGRGRLTGASERPGMTE